MSLTQKDVTTHISQQDETAAGSSIDSLAHLFTHPSGQPILFHFHSSMTRDQKATTAKLILAHGGAITDSDTHTDVILISKTRLAYPLDTLQKKYKDKAYVEPLTFVRKCVTDGVFQLGRVKEKIDVPDIERVNFTEDDDDHLCQYIADVVPNKEAGGRQGNDIYIQLEALGKDPAIPANTTHQFSWAARHPWQSWRNRYSKNWKRLDDRIEEWVNKRRRADGKGEYERQRPIHLPTSVRVPSGRKESQSTHPEEISPLRDGQAKEGDESSDEDIPPPRPNQKQRQRDQDNPRGKMPIWPEDQDYDDEASDEEIPPPRQNKRRRPDKEVTLQERLLPGDDDDNEDIPTPRPSQKKRSKGQDTSVL